MAITLLVRNSKKRGCIIRYKDIGNYLTREQKFEIIRDAESIAGISDWRIIKPDKHHDWLDKRRNDFAKYAAIGDTDAKAGRWSRSVFRMYSRGVATSRDVWAYNSSVDKLASNMKRHTNYCNKQDLDNPIIDPKRAKWTSTLSERLRRTKSPFVENKIRTVLYRPFF